MQAVAELHSVVASVDNEQAVLLVALPAAAELGLVLAILGQVAAVAAQVVAVAVLPVVTEAFVVVAAVVRAQLVLKAAHELVLETHVLPVDVA